MNKSFEKRVVLFIDILGFREKIHCCEKDNDQITNIYNVLSIMKRHFKNYKDIRRIHFSDSIVISFKAEDNGAILEIIGSIQSLIKKVVNQEFLLRGSIAFGDIYHDKDFIYGPAMNKAYDLESKKAIVPRIIIQKDIVELSKEHMPSFFNEGMEEYVYNYISIDLDGNYYIDYFKKGVDTFWEIKNRDKKFMFKLKGIIEKGLQENEMYVNIKYQWMKEKFNELIKELKECKQVTAGGFTIGSKKDNIFYKKLNFIK